MKKTAKKLSLTRETLGGLESAIGGAVVVSLHTGNQATCAQHSCVNPCLATLTVCTTTHCPTGLSCGQIC